MRSILLIVTILTAKALTQDPDECKFSDDVQHCYCAEGQTLIFHVPNTANTDADFRLKKDGGYLILTVSKNKITTAHEELASHAELLSNGRFSLGKAMKKHSGDYMLEVFGPNGEKKGILNVHLEIQAPVSKPAVSQECVSSGKTTVSCSSEGDGLEFNVTLNGHSIVQTKDSSKENMSSSARGKAKNNPGGTGVSISLQGQPTGDVICDVRNKVSRDGTVYQLDSCRIPSSIPGALVAAIVLFIVVVLLLAVHCAFINFLNKKLTPVPKNEDIPQNHQSEVVYSDVKITQNPRTTEPKPEENLTSFSTGESSSTSPV